MSACLRGRGTVTDFTRLALGQVGNTTGQSSLWHRPARPPPPFLWLLAPWTAQLLSPHSREFSLLQAKGRRLLLQGRNSTTHSLLPSRMMITTQRFQLLSFMLLALASSFCSTLLLSQKQLDSSLHTAKNNSHAAVQLLSPNNKVEAQVRFQTSALQVQTMTSLLAGKRRQYLSHTGAEDATLGMLLVAVVRQELRHCDLVLACNGAFCRSSVMHTLLMLPNIRQVVQVRAAEDLVATDWVPNRCGGYLMLLHHLEPLLVLATSHHHSWDYSGRYVVVCGSVTQLEALVASRNGKKTEHVLGVVKVARDTWRLYINQLYWGPGVRTAATIYSHHGLDVLLSDLFPDKVADLRGAVLKVSTFNFEPSIIYYHAENGSLLFRFGEEISLTKALGRTLNFTPAFAEPADGETWGRIGEGPGGTFSGIIGELQRDEVDIVISNLYVSSTRVKYLDFTIPFQIEMACFLARTEPPLPRWQAPAFPFQEWTWLAIVCGLIASGPVLWLVAMASSLSGEERRSFGWLTFSWYYAFGLHFCESQPFLPRMTSTRVFVAFLWVYCMILTMVYSANLTAFLLVRRPPASIETIEDLYHSGLEVAALGEIYLGGIRSASDPNLRGLSEVYRGYAHDSEVLPLVVAGKAVFLESRGFAEFHLAMKFTEGGESAIRIMKECFAPFPIAMALQRHSPLKRKFDEVIGWVLQSGLLSYYFQDSLRLAATMKEYGGEDVAARVQESAVVAMNLDHLQGLFLVAGIGFTISLLVFVIENVHIILN